jgi:hypothetical protein
MKMNKKGTFASGMLLIAKIILILSILVVVMLMFTGNIGTLGDSTDGFIDTLRDFDFGGINPLGDASGDDDDDDDEELCEDDSDCNFGYKCVNEECVREQIPQGDPDYEIVGLRYENEAIVIGYEMKGVPAGTKTDLKVELDDNWETRTNLEISSTNNEVTWALASEHLLYPGDHKIEVKIDAKELVTEKSETNNELTEDITVEADYAVTNIGYTSDDEIITITYEMSGVPKITEVTETEIHLVVKNKADNSYVINKKLKVYSNENVLTHAYKIPNGAYDISAEITGYDDGAGNIDIDLANNKDQTNIGLNLNDPDPVDYKITHLKYERGTITFGYEMINVNQMTNAVANIKVNDVFVKRAIISAKEITSTHNYDLPIGKTSTIKVSIEPNNAEEDTTNNEKSISHVVKCEKFYTCPELGNKINICNINIEGNCGCYEEFMSNKYCLDNCDKCSECGDGWRNICDGNECGDLGPCNYGGGTAGDCDPDPSVCDLSVDYKIIALSYDNKNKKINIGYNTGSEYPKLKSFIDIYIGSEDIPIDRISDIATDEYYNSYDVSSLALGSHTIKVRMGFTNYNEGVDIKDTNWDNNEKHLTFTVSNEPSPECSTDHDCKTKGSTYVCKNNICVDDGSACSDDCDETLFPVCDNDDLNVINCVLQKDGCFDIKPTFCATGEVCKSGTCVDSGSTCSDDCDDALFPICDNSGQDVVDCVLQKDGCHDVKTIFCATGEVCKSGACITEEPECSNDPDCVSIYGPKYICGDDGACVEGEGSCSDCAACGLLCLRSTCNEDFCNFISFGGVGKCEPDPSVCEVDCTDECDETLFPTCEDGAEKICVERTDGCFDILTSYCEFACENNKCGESGAVCTDSDGKDPTIKGTTTLGTDIRTDICIYTNAEVQEHYCSDSGESILELNFKCEDGEVCDDGACIDCSDEFVTCADGTQIKSRYMKDGACIIDDSARDQCPPGTDYELTQVSVFQNNINLRYIFHRIEAHTITSVQVFIDDVRLYSGSISALGSEEGKELFEAISTPAIKGILKNNGEYTIRVELDPYDTTIEDDETNNDETIIHRNDGDSVDCRVEEIVIIGSNVFFNYVIDGIESSVSFRTWVDGVKKTDTYLQPTGGESSIRGIPFSLPSYGSSGDEYKIEVNLDPYNSNCAGDDDISNNDKEATVKWDTANEQWIILGEGVL